jgi:hypothetical protein
VAHFEALVQSSDALLPREVLEELERGDDDCVAWCTAQAGFVVQANDEILLAVASISAQYPEFSQGAINYADPFVIAHAQTRGGTVVSNERRYNGVVQERYRIPNLCEELGVPHLRFVDFMHAQGWTF